MVDAPTINWRGKSGKDYLYWIFPIGTPFNAFGGNYIFAKEVNPGLWKPVYIGQSMNLNERLEYHEQEECAMENGATHIHARTNEKELNRIEEEKDLILEWEPKCNE